MPTGAQAAQAALTPAQELVAQINDYRAHARFCGGRTHPAAPPLAPDAALATVKLAPNADLQALLRAAGYKAARAQAIVVSGTRSAADAMEVLRSKYCEPLLDRHFVQIGVVRDGWTWRIVLAQPLLAPDLGDWRSAGAEILRLTNAARAVGRACGAERFPPAPPLEWNALLAESARAHSLEMARRNYFSHTGRDGSRVGTRAERAGYEWSAIGENIATGQGSPERVMAGWLASPSHCANIMNPRFTQMGAAYALDSRADSVIYWTQVLGAPR